MGIKSIAEAKKAIEEIRDHPARVLASHANHPDDKTIKRVAIAEIDALNETLKIMEELEKSVREKVIELEEALASAPQEYWEEYDSRIKQLKEVLGEDKK